MEIRPLPRAFRRLGLAVAIPALFLAIASIPWRGTPAGRPPRIAVREECSGPLWAGVGAAAFELPPGAPIGGFRRNTWASEGEPGPVGARALVLQAGDCRVAVASAELLLVPRPLADGVRARVADLSLDGLFLGATHTHAGPGGYWDELVAEVAGLGPHDPDLERRLADAIAAAIRRASAGLAPVTAGVRVVPANHLVRGRGGGTEEGRLTLVRLSLESGAPLAEVVVLASHATLLGQRNRRIDGDWPGRLLAASPRGPRLFFQGALGDQSATKEDGRRQRDVEEYALAVSRAADVEVPPGDGPPGLAWAEVEVTLPALEPGGVPGWLRPAARTLLGGLAPETARVSALRVGPALLVGIPAEPVAAVGAAWRARAGEDVVLVSLVGDYVGYAETPERWARGRGETKRTVLGPGLGERLGDGVELAARTVRGPPPAPAP